MFYFKKLWLLCLVVVACSIFVGCGYTGSLQSARNNSINVYINRVEDTPFEQVKANLKDMFISGLGSSGMRLLEDSTGAMISLVATPYVTGPNEKTCFIDFINVEDGNKTKIIAYNWACSKTVINNIIEIAVGRKAVTTDLTK